MSKLSSGNITQLRYKFVSFLRKFIGLLCTYTSTFNSSHANGCRNSFEIRVTRNKKSNLESLKDDHSIWKKNQIEVFEDLRTLNSETNYK